MRMPWGKAWWREGSEEEEERIRIRVATRAASTRAEAMHWVAEMRSRLDKLEECLRNLDEDNDDEGDEDGPGDG